MRNAILFVVLASATSFASAGTIDTIAGSGAGTDNGPSAPALSANMNQPFGLEFGPDGALYICERGLHRIRRLDMQTGELSTVAGTGKPGHKGDGGPAIEAQLYEPHELRFDAAGNLSPARLEVAHYLNVRRHRRPGRFRRRRRTGDQLQTRLAA